MRFHHDLDILIERHQEAQQAFHGELAEFAAQHLRDIRLADSEQFSGFHLLEAAFFRIVSILNTSCALTRCSSALGTPMSLNTLPLPVSYGFLLLIALSLLQFVRPRAVVA